MVAETKLITIAIIGGGISGLSLCLGLCSLTPNPNIAITIYEAAPEFTETGAGIALGPNSIHAIEMINPVLKELLIERGMKVAGPESASFLKLRYGARGPDSDKTIAELTAEGQSTIKRSDLVEEMAKLLPDGIAKLGKRAVSVDQANGKVTVRFADGSTEQTDFLIGCDGIKSLCRKAVLGPDSAEIEPVFTGLRVYRVVAKMEEVENLIGKDIAHSSNMIFGTDSYMLIYPLSGGKSVNMSWAFVGDEPWDQKQWMLETPTSLFEKDLANEKWSDTYHRVLPVFRSANYFGIHDHPSTSTYVKDRICILGDAAHASSPSQGNGAAMALEDTLVLSRLLKHVSNIGDVTAAFSAFDATRRPRASKQQLKAREADRIFSMREKGVGNDIEKLRQNTEFRWDWLQKIDLEQHVKDAEVLFRKYRSHL